MKFSIITPTHNRPQLLRRAIESALGQKHTDWEMIIVNDSPNYDYADLENWLNPLGDARIIYLRNSKNEGVNYTRNKALANVRNDSDFVTFLDDDDWLSPTALDDLTKAIDSFPNHSWYISNLSIQNGETITKIAGYEKTYDYTRNYLLGRKVRNDATHCIRSNLLKEKNIRFSTHILQAEEWIFFYQTSLYTKMFALNITTKLTDGYLDKGLSKGNKESIAERLKKTLSTLKELRERKILRPEIVVYLILKTIKHVLV